MKKSKKRKSTIERKRIVIAEVKLTQDIELELKLTPRQGGGLSRRTQLRVLSEPSYNTSNRSQLSS